MRKMRWALVLTCVLGGCEAELLGEAEVDEAEELGSVQAALSGSDVGVIPEKGTNCPGKRVEIEVWPETRRNNNHSEGWIGGWTWNDKAVGLMAYCKVPSAGFKQVKGTSAGGNYAVLKLGASCPAGSFEVVRYFDLEDDMDKSYKDEDKAYPPSHHGGLGGMNLWLHLCVFKAAPGGSSTPFPDLGFHYGVLGGEGVPGDTATGFAYNDDEDERNHTRWEMNDDNVDLSAIIEGRDNSRMKLVRVR